MINVRGYTHRPHIHRQTLHSESRFMRYNSDSSQFDDVTSTWDGQQNRLLRPSFLFLLYTLLSCLCLCHCHSPSARSTCACRNNGIWTACELRNETEYKNIIYFIQHAHIEPEHKRYKYSTFCGCIFMACRGRCECSPWEAEKNKVKILWNNSTCLELIND